MPRFYDIVKPSANKAASPGKEKKAGKPSGGAPDKGEGKPVHTSPGGDDSGQKSPENAG